MEKLCNGLRLMKLNHRDLFPFGRRMMIDPDSGLEGQEKDTGPDQPYSDATVDAFLHVLKSAVCKRVSNLPSLEVYVLFDLSCFLFAHCKGCLEPAHRPAGWAYCSLGVLIRSYLPVLLIFMSAPMSASCFPRSLLRKTCSYSIHVLTSLRPIDLLNVAFTGKPSESPANGQAAEQTPSSKTPPKSVPHPFTFKPH